MPTEKKVVSGYLHCRNRSWTESSVKQPRITAVTDDEELMNTNSLVQFYFYFS